MLNGLRRILSQLVLIGLPLPALAIEAMPEFTVISTVETAEKGHNFRMLVEIDTEQPLTEVVVTAVSPEGFCLEALEVPGVKEVATSIPRLTDEQIKALAEKLKMDEDNIEQPECAGLPNIARIDAIAAASFIVPFRVYPPDLSGEPRSGGKASLYSTREDKVFAFNVLYKLRGNDDEARGSASMRLTLPYTTSLGHYLAAGLVGVFLGFLVKVLTQERDEIYGTFTGAGGIGAKAFGLVNHLLLLRIPMLLTLMVIGFGALLALANDGIPVSSWSQSIALGLGLGILGDEKLITKIRPGG